MSGFVNIASFVFHVCIFYGRLFIFLTGSAESVRFEQSSPQIVEGGFKELRINCKHDDSSLSTMLWYQQKQNLTLIGYVVIQSPPEYEPQFKNRFQITRADMLSGHLSIGTVDPADSAVYFCAASTQ